MAMSEHYLTKPRNLNGGRQSDVSPKRSVVASGSQPSIRAMNPSAVLDLQRLAGNRAVSGLVSQSRTAQSGSLVIQRLGEAPSELPNPWAKKTKRSAAGRFFSAIGRSFRTTFSSDPGMRKAKIPKVSEDDRLVMMRAMDEAVRNRDETKQRLMTDSFLPEEAAEQRANELAFSHLPEDWRPRNITPAERQRRKNEATFAEESMATSQTEQDKTTLTDQGAGRMATKEQREAEHKVALGQVQDPEEIKRRQAQHKEDKEARTARKKALRDGWEKHDKEDEAKFDALLKKMDKNQKAAAKKLREDMIAKRKKQRMLAIFQEEVSHYPEEERNAKVADYAKLKGISLDPLGVGDSDTAASGLGGASTAIGLGGTVAGSLSSVSEGLQKLGKSGISSSIVGTSTSTPDFVTLPTGVKEQVEPTVGGTANQGGDILGAASDLTGFGTQIASLVSGFKRAKGGNPAQQLQADDDIVDNVQNLGQTTTSLGADALNLMEGFGSSALAMQAAAVLPMVDLVMNIQRLIQDGVKVYDNAKRAKAQGKLKDLAEEIGRDTMHLGLQLSYGRGVHLAAHYIVDAIATGLAALGNIVALAGVTYAVGHGISIAAKAVGGANKAARTVADSYLAGKTLESRRNAQLAKPGSSEALIRHDPKHATQTFIDRARDGDPLALKTLESFGITPDVLERSDDPSLRSAMLSKLELSENPQTISGKAASALKSGWKTVKSVATSIKNTFGPKETELEDLLKVKNELNYGGKNDRDWRWKAKQRLKWHSTLVGEKSKLARAIAVSQLSEQRKAELLKLTMTPEEKKRHAQRDRDAQSSQGISGPTDVKAHVKQPLESMSQAQLVEVINAGIDPDQVATAFNLWGAKALPNINLDLLEEEESGGEAPGQGESEGVDVNAGMDK